MNIRTVAFLVLAVIFASTLTANAVPQKLYSSHALYWAMVTVTDNQTQEVTVYPARKVGPR